MECKRTDAGRMTSNIDIAVVSKVNRIPSIDGLRAVAVSLVVAAHATTLPGVAGSTGGYVVSKIFSGSAGVQIFFVISGFIITYLFIAEASKNGTINLKRFYIRRGFRLMPPALTFLFVLFLLTNIKELNVSNLEFISSLFFFRNYINDGGWLTGHIWSLSVEEQFYFLWPLVMICFLRKATLVLVIALVAAPVVRYIALWNEIQGWSYWLLSNMDGLAAGCLLAFHYSRCSAWESALSARSRLYLRIVAFGVFPLVAAFPGRFYLYLAPLQVTMVSTATVFLIASLTTTRAGYSYAFLNWSPVVKIGIISYSLYLWQQLFLAPNPILDLPVPLAILTALVIGWLSWLLLERPFASLRRKFHG